jgi:hypothetical protein
MRRLRRRNAPEGPRCIIASREMCARCRRVRRRWHPSSMRCRLAGKKPATIRRYFSTIALAHRVANLVNPCADEFVQLEIKGLYNVMSARQRQVKALGWEQEGFRLRLLNKKGRARLGIVRRRGNRQGTGCSHLAAYQREELGWSAQAGRVFHY